MNHKSLVFYAFLLSAIFLTKVGYAQSDLCKGALGDPIKNIDFGRGITQYGPPIAETTFNFAASGTPPDGSYTIAKSTDGMHIGNWHQIRNHTPNDPNGYMMIINASDRPSVFYESPITDLCPNTIYQFSAWVINLLTYSGNKPNLTFSIITNTETIPFNTGDIREGSPTNWIEYGFSFKTPHNVDNVIMRIQNNGPGGNGNDIALDDITFRACGPVITPSVNGVITAQKDICIGEKRDYVLSAEVTPGVYTNTEYLWQQFLSGDWRDMPGEITNSLTVNFENQPVGSYKYRLLVAEFGNINSSRCRTNSTEFTLNVVPPPAKPTPDSPKTFCLGESIFLSVNEASSYKWTGPNNFNSTERSPVIGNATNEMAGIYTVIIANESGCEASADVDVHIIPKPEPTVDATSPICKGDPVQLNAHGGTAYRWLPSATLSATDIPNPIARPLKTTTYTVYVSNDYCEVPISVTVEVIKTLVANAGPDRKIIKGNATVLNGQVSGENILKSFWTPSDYLDDARKLNPVATPPTSITYTLNVISSTGCTSSYDEVSVKVYEKLIIPNSFSPNGDGVNDEWNIVAIDTYINPKVRVMNRYGQLMFEGAGDKTSWNGKYRNADVPVGVYYYIVNLEPGLKPITGSLTVIR